MTFARKIKQGFKLIELLVVIAIIVLLMGILTPTLWRWSGSVEGYIFEAQR